MDFEKILTIQNTIAPEMMETILRRYDIMKMIDNLQPVGRRVLASAMGMSERTLRSETDKLRTLSLVESDTAGMHLTESAQQVIVQVESLIYTMKGITDLELKVRDKLQIQKVSIVEGDYNQSDFIRRNLGKKAARIIEDHLTDNMRIGIMGGTTMALVADEIKMDKKFSNVMIVPGRGGLGEKLEIQANSIAAKMAHRIGATYKLLHIPDNIGSEVLEALKQNEQIRNVLNEIKRIDMIIFGIGTAEEMAQRRGLSELKKSELFLKKAFAESLGYYFNKKGQPVTHTDTVGLALTDLKNIKHAICVAAGTNKAEAIYAFSKYHKEYTLVTDEVTAREILNL